MATEPRSNTSLIRGTRCVAIDHSFKVMIMSLQMLFVNFTTLFLAYSSVIIAQMNNKIDAVHLFLVYLNHCLTIVVSKDYSLKNSSFW